MFARSRRASTGRGIYVVEKHAPLYLRGKKERVYVSRQGNIGTTFQKIILRAGIIPWGKLIHNLRASFETDLLNGEYGQFGLHTIAQWLGHSVQVMLEHYGRHKQSDYDQIAEACEQVKKRKAQKAAHILDPCLIQNDRLPLASTASNLSEGVAQKAAQYTAVWGGIGQNRAESPSFMELVQLLTGKELSGTNRQEVATRVSSLNYHSGGQGIRTLNRSPGN